MPITLNGSGTATGLTAAPNLTSSGLTTGKVIQIVSGTSTTSQSTSSTSWSDTNLSASITPSSSSNKIYILVQQPFKIVRSGEYDTHAGIQLLRGSTVIQETRERSGGGKSEMIMGVATSASSAYYAAHHMIQFLDSPSTTSSTTYKTQYAVDHGSVLYLNNPDTDTSKTPMSVMTLMEIAA
tara:strand:+ start:109 stop:654 length:546 start_codon:yes stop_codon:yes gene_type:complete